MQNTNDDYQKILNDLEKLERKLSEHKQQSERDLTLTAKLLAPSSRLYTLIDSTLQRFIKLTKAQRGFLILVNETGEYEVKIARNFAKDSELDSALHFSKSIIQKVLVEKEPILTQNASEDSNIDLSSSILNLKLKSVLCVPLMIDTTLIGVIYLENNERTGQFKEHHLNSLKDFAYRASISIKTKLAYLKHLG